LICLFVSSFVTCPFFKGESSFMLTESAIFLFTLLQKFVWDILNITSPEVWLLIHSVHSPFNKFKRWWLFVVIAKNRFNHFQTDRKISLWVISNFGK
jgi:hypothetical protein